MAARLMGHHHCWRVDSRGTPKASSTSLLEILHKSIRGGVHQDAQAPLFLANDAPLSLLKILCWSALSRKMEPTVPRVPTNIHMFIV